MQLLAIPAPLSVLEHVPAPESRTLRAMQAEAEYVGYP